MLARLSCVLLVLILTGCESGPGVHDAGASSPDAAQDVDSGLSDSGASDSGVSDSGVSDSGTPGTCAPLDYGAPAVRFTSSDADPPVATGGSIPMGSYDLVRAVTYSGSAAPFMRVRGTWVFESTSVLHTREAFSSTTVLPSTPARSWAWSSAAAQITRTATCSEPSPPSRTHTYSVVTVAGGSAEFLIIAGNTALTYRRR